jgi:hypothetical protein
MIKERKEDLHAAIDRILFLSGIALLIIHAIRPISYKAQIIFFLLTVLLAGIPHGALDHLVEEKNRHLEKKSFTWFSFLANYFIYMLLFGLIWYFIPSLALIIFLIFSSIHFGETDLLRVKITGGVITKLMQFCYGGFILLILLLSHPAEVKMIVEQYPGLIGMHQIQFLEAHTKDIIFGSGMVAAATAFIYFLKTGQDNEGLFSFSFFSKLLLLLLLLITLPLILSFAFYFGLWHSLHSLENIRMHLCRESQTHIGWPALMQKSLPLTILAILFIGAIIYFAHFDVSSSSLLLQFFIGIAILTAPHLQVMGRMYRRR